MITAQANRILVSVEQYSAYDLSGRFFTPLQAQEIPFFSFAELVLKLERQFDELKIPQKTHEIRRFFSVDVPQEQPVHGRTLFPHAADGRKGKGGFIIHVYFRQNASWQGRVEWLDGKKVEDFRSVLELLYLMLDALNGKECQKQSGDQEMVSYAQEV